MLLPNKTLIKPLAVPLFCALLGLAGANVLVAPWKSLHQHTSEPTASDPTSRDSYYLARLKENPDSLADALNYALSLRRQKRDQEALQVLEPVFNKSKKAGHAGQKSIFFSASLTLVELQLNFGRYIDGEQNATLTRDYFRAQRNANDEYLALSQLFWSHMYQHQYHQAEVEANEMVSISERTWRCSMYPKMCVSYTADWRGDKKKAEKILKEEIIKASKSKWKNHRDLGNCHEALARLYESQGRMPEALPHRVEALRIAELHGNADFEKIFRSKCRVASAYCGISEFKKAESMLKQLLQESREECGFPRGLQVAIVNSRLSEIYHETNQSELAEKYCREALAYFQKTRHDGYDVANLRGNLGLFLSDNQAHKGPGSEAEKLLRQNLLWREQHCGAENEETLTAINNLATVLEDTEQYAEAEKLYKKAIALRKKVFGDNSAITASSLHNLAHMYFRQKKYRESNELSSEALAICQATLGSDNSHTVMYEVLLASTLVKLGRYSETEPLLEHALKRRTYWFGADSEKTTYVADMLRDVRKNR